MKIIQLMEWVIFLYLQMKAMRVAGLIRMERDAMRGPKITQLIMHIFKRYMLIICVEKNIKKCIHTPPRMIKFCRQEKKGTVLIIQWGI